MRLYTIFDDFDPIAAQIIRGAGITLDIHPKGVARPDQATMKRILEEYDGVIIGTSQKIGEAMLDSIKSPKIIATASVGTDHIQIPKEKRDFFRIYNTPKANAQAVAEYTFATALSCLKRIEEGRRLYLLGKDNKSLSQKPVELFGKTLGVIGAGAISKRIMEFGQFFGMDIFCFTRHPEKHEDLQELGVKFSSLWEVAKQSDVLSVNLPNVPETKGIVSKELVSCMKSEGVFVSVSRLDTISFPDLLEKSKQNRNFYTCLDIDGNEEVARQSQGMENVIVTPHIAGGTRETRIRMFRELARQITS
jgi:D-3-phosphoglycerate dehydrogenase